MAVQVFISYSSADGPVEQRVCGSLETAGISCWIAPRDIQPGTDYPAAIVDAVAAAAVLVLVLTEHAVGSPHIVTEVGHAFSSRKRIVPFRIEHATLSKDLDYFLSMAQWLDAESGCTDENLQKLVAAVESAVRGEAPTGSESGWRGRRKKIAVLAAAVLLFVAGMTYAILPRSRNAKDNNGTPPVTGVSQTTTSAGAIGTAPAEATLGGMPAAPAKTEPTVKTTEDWTNPVDGEVYIHVLPGEFTMGCSPGDGQCNDDEKPAHPVEIEKAFWLARTETTVAAYRKLAARLKVEVPPGADQMPAAGVSYGEAKAFCAAVGGRLPYEAEWEYAARGGTSGAYYGVVPAIAWYADNSGGVPHPVAGKKPNSLGLYDMLGNVSEWVQDRYYNKYDLSAPPTGKGVDLPLAPNASAAVRGGFWDGDTADIRVSRRLGYPPDYADANVGFRCANDHM